MSLWYKGRLRSADYSSSQKNAVKILDEIFRPNSSSGININNQQIQNNDQQKPTRNAQILRSRYSSPNKQSFNRMIFSAQRTSDNSMNSTFCKTSASSSIMDSKSLRKMAKSGYQQSWLQSQILEQQEQQQCSQEEQPHQEPYLAVQDIQQKKPKKKTKRRVLSAQKEMQLALQFTPYLSRANTAKQGSRKEQKGSLNWVTPNHQKITAIPTTATRYNSSDINNNNTRKSRQAERQQIDDVNRQIKFDMSSDSKGRSRRISNNDIAIENQQQQCQMQIEDQEGFNKSSSSSNNINVLDMRNYVSNSIIDYSQDMRSNRLTSKSRSYQSKSDSSQKITRDNNNQIIGSQINENSGFTQDNNSPRSIKKISKQRQSAGSTKQKLNLDLSIVKSQQPWHLQSYSPHWNQSSATLRFSSQSHSFGKADRFGNDVKHFENKLVIELPSTLKNRSASFGFGKKTDIFPQKHIQRAQVTPSPQSHNILRFPDDNLHGCYDSNAKGHVSPGKTFGISFESYRRNFLKHAEKTVYAPEIQADHPGPDAYDVRETIGKDKLHFSILKRLPMFNELGIDKQIPTSTKYSVNERLVVNKRFEGITFGIGERIDLAKPANDYPGPIYDLISQFSRPQSSQ